MAKINIDLTVGNVSCKECQFFDYEIDWCNLFEADIYDCCRCKACLQHEVKESEKNNKVFDEMQKLCNLDLDIEEFKKFKQIQAKLAAAEKNLAIAQDERDKLKKETYRLSHENTELQKLVDTLNNQLSALISNSYSLIKKAQSDTATSIYRKLHEACEPFFIKDENKEE